MIPPRVAAAAGIAGGQHRQRAAAVGGRRGHEPGRLLSLAATLMLLARRSTEDPPERREAVQRPHAGLLARASPAASTGKGPRRWIYYRVLFVLKEYCKAVSYSSQILKVKFFTLDDDELVDPSFQN